MLPPHYAESVALVGFSDDARHEVSIRLARFPDQGRGELWLFVHTPEVTYGLADPSLGLAGHAAATPVTEASIRMRVDGSSQATFGREIGADGRLRGTATLRAVAGQTAHPEPGPGTLPVAVDATFTAAHAPVRVRAGRLEVTGRVQATITTPHGTFTLDAPGKWHEQTGPRERFGSAFTYFNVQGADVALLASLRHDGGVYGYLARGAVTEPVTAFTIDPLGTPVRAFSLRLADGTHIDGTATLAHATSVPIEGARRPGALVVVESSIGRLVGHLNDWQPPPLPAPPR